MKTLFPSKAAAEAAGYRVDTTTYPWVAYRGPRFQPIKWGLVPTDREARLTAFVQDVARTATMRPPAYLRQRAQEVLLDPDDDL